MHGSHVLEARVACGAMGGGHVGCCESGVGVVRRFWHGWWVLFGCCCRVKDAWVL